MSCVRIWFNEYIFKCLRISQGWHKKEKQHEDAKPIVIIFVKNLFSHPSPACYSCEAESRGIFSWTTHELNSRFDAINDFHREKA